MQRARYPCRQLNSKTIRSAALGYLSPVFLGKCSIISAKCVCKIDEEGIENAWKYVCRTRDLCDRKLKGLLLTVFHYFKQVSTSLGCSKSIDQDLSISFVGVKNVAFFFSSISTQSLKEKRGKRNVKDKAQALFITPVPSREVSHIEFERTRRLQGPSQEGRKRTRPVQSQPRTAKKPCTNQISNYFPSQTKTS